MKILRKIKRVLEWVPVLWNDEDFDYAHLLEIMIFKLKRMENFFNSKYAWSSDAKQQAASMRLFRVSLERILEEYEYDPDVRRNMELRASDIEFAGNQFKKVVEWWD